MEQNYRITPEGVSAPTGAATARSQADTSLVKAKAAVLNALACGCVVIPLVAGPVALWALIVLVNHVTG